MKRITTFLEDASLKKIFILSALIVSVLTITVYYVVTSTSKEALLVKNVWISALFFVMISAIMATFILDFIRIELVRSNKFWEDFNGILRLVENAETKDQLMSIRMNELAQLVKKSSTDKHSKSLSFLIIYIEEKIKFLS